MFHVKHGPTPASPMESSPGRTGAESRGRERPCGSRRRRSQNSRNHLRRGAGATHIQPHQCSTRQSATASVDNPSPNGGLWMTTRAATRLVVGPAKGAGNGSAGACQWAGACQSGWHRQVAPAADANRCPWLAPTGASRSDIRSPLGRRARTACRLRDASRMTDRGMGRTADVSRETAGHPAGLVSRRSRPRSPGRAPARGSSEASAGRPVRRPARWRPGRVASRSGGVPAAGWCPGSGGAASVLRTHRQPWPAGLEARSGRGRPQDDVANQRPCFAFRSRVWVSFVAVTLRAGLAPLRYRECADDAPASARRPACSGRLSRDADPGAGGRWSIGPTWRDVSRETREVTRTPRRAKLVKPPGRLWRRPGPSAGESPPAQRQGRPPCRGGMWPALCTGQRHARGRRYRGVDSPQASVPAVHVRSYFRPGRGCFT